MEFFYYDDWFRLKIIHIMSLQLNSVTAVVTGAVYLSKRFCKILIR